MYGAKSGNVEELELGLVGIKIVVNVVKGTQFSFHNMMTLSVRRNE